MLSKFSQLLFGWPRFRFAHWAILAGSLLVLIVAGPLAGKFESAQKNDLVDFLPRSSESLRVAEAQKKLPGAETITAAVISEEATNPQRMRALQELRTQIAADSPEGTIVSNPQPARDGKATLMAVTYKAGVFRGETEALTGRLEKLRRQVKDAPGVKAQVGGQLGFAGDSIKVFRGINSTLLYATALLVMVLLLFIYRSPIFWILPILAVGGAEILARAGGYLLASSGVTVTGQSAGILSVLVFGAGTDYALLLVARYREELRNTSSDREAMQTALTKTAPTILASGATVIAGLMCLSLAQVKAIAGLGPAGAVGIAAAMISSVTLLPALLLAGGRKFFWPLIPRPGSAGAKQGPWRRVGEMVAKRARVVLLAGLGVLAVMCIGLTYLSKPLSADQGFRSQVESVKAQKIIERHFPAGVSSPVLVLVSDAASSEEASRRLRAAPQIAFVAKPGPQGPPGQIVAATLKSDPASGQAIKDIKEIRKRLAGTGAIVGGSSAQEADLRQATHKDNLLLIPLISLLVLLILMVILRSVLMPLLLMLTVIVSCGAALGAVSWFSVEVLGAPGVAASLPIITFVFLVALGVDYNIFLAARAREETAEHGTKEGMLRALAVTGAVITSAGVVLAGTFLVLLVLPLWTLTETGLAVAFGVLLDTLLVRSLLVPAATFLAGPRIWWPWKPKA